MKPEKQRIKIAEACGWKWNTASIYEPGGHRVSRRKDVLSGLDNVPDVLPDYLNDLNAMHEAVVECFKTDNSGMSFYASLEDVVQGWMIDSGIPYGYLTFWTINATAAQRAEAFLKTIGKWEEE